MHSHSTKEPPIAAFTPGQQLQSLQSALLQLQADPLRSLTFLDVARQQKVLLEALPARFDEVLQDLLDRLESSALFTEESCSFSQSDLVASLQLWIDKAHARLQSPVKKP